MGTGRARGTSAAAPPRTGSAPHPRDVGQRRHQMCQLDLAGDAELGVDVPDGWPLRRTVRKGGLFTERR